jgi:hypothetical protein
LSEVSTSVEIVITMFKKKLFPSFETIVNSQRQGSLPTHIQNIDTLTHFQ